MSNFVKQAKEEAKSHLIKNDRLARFQNRAWQGFEAAIFKEVEDPTPRPSKHYFFTEEVDRPQDPKPPARDQDDSVTNHQEHKQPGTRCT